MAPRKAKGVSVYRPFVYGSIAHPLPANAHEHDPNLPADHTHRWTVYVRGVGGADLTHWLQKVTFQLHETYPQRLRTVEAPAPFEVTETGWGEFEVRINLHFVEGAPEKPLSLYHQLKLHPWGADREAAKARGDPVLSQNYEEIVWTEPSMPLYDALTNAPVAAPAAPPPVRGKAGAAKGGKGAKAPPKKLTQASGNTATIPQEETADNPYSVRTEERELDRLKEALKRVEETLAEEQEQLAESEKELAELRQGESSIFKPK